MNALFRRQLHSTVVQFHLIFGSHSKEFWWATYIFQGFFNWNFRILRSGTPILRIYSTHIQLATVQSSKFICHYACPSASNYTCAAILPLDSFVFVVSFETTLKLNLWLASDSKTNLLINKRDVAHTTYIHFEFPVMGSQVTVLCECLMCGFFEIVQPNGGLPECIEHTFITDWIRFCMHLYN